jgi:hypothetical protein
MPLTRLGLYGGPRPQYGSFSGKGEVGHPVGRITRLGLYGGPRALYGSFDGKAANDEETSQSGDRRLQAYYAQRRRNQEALKVELQLRAVEQDEIIQIVNTIRELLE